MKILVPISGGKDSQACLQLAVTLYGPDDVRGLFCDTQWEHPLTYAHVEWMRQHYGVRIDIVTGGSVPEKSLKYKRFPGGGARHCTDELKIRETRIYCKKLAEELGHGFEVWYGMRHAESGQRKRKYAGMVCDELYPPHQIMPHKYPKYFEKLGIMFRLAILEWHTDDVLEFVGRENLNPLYAFGFDRVGCFPCMASADKWKRMAFEFDDFGQQQYKTINIVSEQIGKPVFNKSESIGCMVCAI